MLNRSRCILLTLGAASAAFAGSGFAADNSSWLEHQLSISDGYSQTHEAPGPQGQRGDTLAKPQSDSSWLEQQRSMSDGYSQPTGPEETRASVYVGLQLETSSQEDFVQRGRRMTDGTLE